MYSRHLLVVFQTLCVIVALFSGAVPEPLRRRRQTSRHQYTVDTMVVVDERLYSWFKQWMMTTSNVPKVDKEAKLKEYVSLMIHQVNARYAGIDSLSYVINFQVVSVMTNQNILGNQTTGSSSVDAGTALDVFKGWLRPIQRGTYDHAILLTGHKLTGGNSGGETKGRAYIGKLCDSNGFSASIVQEDGAFQSAHYVSHELAHNLGSEHDGEGLSGTRCSASDRYIMAPVRDTSETTTNRVNPWHFSSCSTAAIDIVINSITTSFSDCLSSTLTPIPEFTETVNKPAGQVYPAQTQCQMLHGSSSHLCLGGGFGDLGDICTKMFCMDPSRSPQSGGRYYCALHFAAEGTTCGNKKWCRLGMCVENKDAPETDLECPNGDSSLSINGLSCSGFVNENTWACYNESLRKACCASCQSMKGSSEECLYGNKVTGCSKQFCGRTTTSGKPYSANCCATCAADPTPSTSTCSDVARIDGVSCAARVTQNGPQECYNSTVAASCCQTCSQSKTNVIGCEYGNRVKGSYCSITADTKQECADKRLDCCWTCGQFSGASGSHWSGLVLSLVVLCGWVIHTVQL